MSKFSLEDVADYFDGVNIAQYVGTAPVYADEVDRDASFVRAVLRTKQKLAIKAGRDDSHAFYSHLETLAL